MYAVVSRFSPAWPQEDLDPFWKSPNFRRVIMLSICGFNCVSYFGLFKLSVFTFHTVAPLFL